MSMVRLIALTALLDFISQNFLGQTANLVLLDGTCQRKDRASSCHAQLENTVKTMVLTVTRVRSDGFKKSRL